MPIGMVHGIFSYHYFKQGTVVVSTKQASATNRRDKAVINEYSKSTQAVS